MPTINGVVHQPVPASKAQETLIEKWEANKALLTKIYKEQDMILKSLSGEILDRAIVVEAPEDEEILGPKIYKTYFLSKPIGKYVVFPELDFIHNSKTTKKDLEFVSQPLVG